MPCQGLTRSLQHAQLRWQALSKRSWAGFQTSCQQEAQLPCQGSKVLQACAEPISGW